MSIAAKRLHGSRCHLGRIQASAHDDIVLDRDKKGCAPENGPKIWDYAHNPKFSAHFYCGQTAGYIKMPLGMEVGHSPGKLDGDTS